MKPFYLPTIVLFLFAGGLQAQILLETTEVDTATVASGLDIPWEIQYGPDDHLWVTERYGLVSRIHPVSGEKTVVLDLSGTVYQAGESGLLGLALHPDFSNSPHVFLAYTYSSGGAILERIVRYTYSGGQLAEAFVLLDDIPANTTHDGCRLLITPDMKLLATTGDAQNQPAAQNLNSLAGKVLRLNLDGTVPADNPWPGSPVYTLGHRNAQGLAYGQGGLLYSSEHGPSTDDEFNAIEEARNYGWPNVHGFCNLPDEITFCNANDVAEPLAAWTPTIATSDILYYDHPAIPEWSGRMLLTTLKNKRLYVLELDASGMQVVGQDQYFQNLWGRLRDVCMAPDGAVYLATNGPDWGNSQPFTHRIVKVWNPDYVFSAAENTGDLRGVRILPEAASGNLHIYAPAGMGKVPVRLYSLTGRLILQAEMRGPETLINTAHLSPGIYLVTVGDESQGLVREKVFLQ